jgi:iron complex transport system permease protein
MLLLIAFTAVVVGAASLGLGDALNAFVPSDLPADASDFATIVIFQLRLPRILLAVLAGIALGVSGAVMQGVLRNPLVSPYTLGLSSGAACGAAFAIVLGAGILAAGPYLLIANAFIFGLSTLLLVLGISRIRGTSIETIILAGVALGYLFSGHNVSPQIYNRATIS